MSSNTSTPDIEINSAVMSARLCASSAVPEGKLEEIITFGERVGDGKGCDGSAIGRVLMGEIVRNREGRSERSVGFWVFGGLVGDIVRKTDGSIVNSEGFEVGDNVVGNGKGCEVG